MRPLLTFILSILTTIVFSQSESLVTFKDADRFEIGVPSGWQYGPGQGLPLIAQRRTTETADKSHAGFNVNIIGKRAPSSVDREYGKLIGYLRSSNNFQLLEQDTITINGQPCRWFVENHRNEMDGTTPTCNYVFITYKNDRTYIVTFSLLPADFPKYRPLFDKIAGTLVIY
jgi:hypothetical protein